MRRLLLFFALVAQGQNFPTTVSTTANIPAAANRARTTLATTVNNAITTVVLTSATGFAVNMPFTIGTEDIICTTLVTNTFSGCTRGYDGSTAASHTAGVAVTGTIVAAHNNKLRLEVLAIEQALAARTLDYCADAGSTDDYACSLTPPPSSYATGQSYCFKANTANTTGATVDFNGLGQKAIVKVIGGITTVLASNDIRVGQIVCVSYDGTNMQMQSTLGNAPSGSGDLLSTNNLSDVANAATALANLGIVKFSCTTAPDVTCTFYDDTAVTGITQYIIRAGAGQNAALQQWQDSAGTTLASVLSTGESWFLSAGAVKTEKGANYLLSSDACAKFHAGTNVFGTSADAGLCRNAAGVVEVNNGTPGTFRDLKLRTLKKSTLTIATLPGTPAAGDEVDVTDSATGDCVTGGGSIFAGCRYNGTAWEAF